MEDKSKIVFNFWSMVQAQGMSFVLITAMTGFFYFQFVKLTERIETCNDHKVEILLQVSQNSTDAINRSNGVIERNTNVFDRMNMINDK